MEHDPGSKTPTDNELRTLATLYPFSFHEFRNVGVAHGMDAETLRNVAGYALAHGLSLYSAADALCVADPGREPEPTDAVVISMGALQMAINALRRDEANGMKARGEIVDEIVSAIRQRPMPDTPAPDEVAQPDEDVPWDATLEADLLRLTRDNAQLRDRIAALVAEREEYHRLLIWLLYHHQGGHSWDVGQPIRKVLKIGQFEHLTEHELSIARQYESTMSAGKEAPDA